MGIYRIYRHCENWGSHGGEDLGVSFLVAASRGRESIFQSARGIYCLYLQV